MDTNTTSPRPTATDALTVETLMRRAHDLQERIKAQHLELASRMGEREYRFHYGYGNEDTKFEDEGAWMNMEAIEGWYYQGGWIWEDGDRLCHAANEDELRYELDWCMHDFDSVEELPGFDSDLGILEIMGGSRDYIMRRIQDIVPGFVFDSLHNEPRIEAAKKKFLMEWIETLEYDIDAISDAIDELPDEQAVRSAAEALGMPEDSQTARLVAMGAIDTNEGMRRARIIRARHEKTDYDDLLAEGYDRETAREMVKPEMDEALDDWSE